MKSTFIDEFQLYFTFPKYLKKLCSNMYIIKFLEESTSRAIVTLVERVSKALDRRIHFLCFLRSKEAFDTVYHSILPNKLEDYGIRRIQIRHQR